MKILGITAEYNPFHNGHKYHLEKSLETAEADYTIAVMSGNFTQRGETAILDKWTRSRLAVENGIDLVVELPFVFACNRAETFARGAVDILSGMGATHLSFGSESGELDELQTLMEDLSEHEAPIAEKRSRLMRQGYSFAKSNQLAVEDLFGKARASLMRMPNNILALEYLKRISHWNERGQGIKPVTVARHGAGYFEGNEAEGFAGASYIRKLSTTEEAGRYVPANVKAALTMERNDEYLFFQIVRSLIVRSNTEELSEIYCMGEGLENRFKKEIVRAAGLKELLSAMVSRRYTEAAIRRILVYILVGMRGKNPPEALYARVLAAGSKGQELLRLIRKRGLNRIPLITNINKDDACGQGICNTLYYDVLSADMYNLLHERDLYVFSDKVKKPYME